MMSRYGYFGGFNNMMGGGWLGLFVMVFIGVVILGLLVLLVLWAVRSSHRHDHMHAPATAAGGQPPAATPLTPAPAGHEEAVAIAKRRFASGEITREQYNEIMTTLKD